MNIQSLHFNFKYVAKCLTRRPIKGGKRVLIFAQGRSGSTLLEDLICSPRQFSKNGEILADKRHPNGFPWFPTHYVRSLSRYQMFLTAHVKIYHLLDHQIIPHEFLNALSHEGWHLIHLKRRNVVRQALSNFVAEQRGTFHNHQGKVTLAPFEVDLEAFCERVTFRIEMQRQESEALCGLDFLSVEYESDLEHSSRHQVTSDRIFEFLELPPAPVQTTYRRIAPTDYSDLILNYNDVMKMVRENGWSQYLHSQT